MPKNQRLGSYITCSTTGETYAAYIPPPLPPNPPLRLSAKHHSLIEKATLALGRLDGMLRLFPDTALFLYFYVRKEALLSSQIEGTQSSFADLLLFESDEAPGVPLDDVQEVSNYIAAMNHGISRLRAGFPLSLRLLRELHKILLSGARGGNKDPGEFRRSQNWIGGTRPSNAAFVPPPPHTLMECLGALEKFLHDDPAPTPLLIKAALAHVQFETIHPFLDGNGRVGRLLITLLFCAEGALSEPMLYLSLYFKTHRRTYYHLLQTVRTEGGWENWLSFFLTGVLETAQQAMTTAQRLLELAAQDQQRIERLGRAAVSALRLHQLLQKTPILTTPKATLALASTKPTVSAALRRLQELGIVREITGRQRNRLFVYHRYLKILEEGTAPLR